MILFTTYHRHLKGKFCLLYTSDAADERSSVDLGGRRIIKKKKKNTGGGRRNWILKIDTSAEDPVNENTYVHIR